MTLSLEIRDDKINIYYRGGSLLRINRKGGTYYPHFDSRYLIKENWIISDQDLQEKLLSKSVTDWLEVIPILKHTMDIWFGYNPKDEREFQQLVVRENNFAGPARNTDYFICDIEYANKNGRFDMIAAKWPSTSQARKCKHDIRLAFIEMKYMDKALTGDAGIKEHIINLNNYLSLPRNLTKLKEEMLIVFNQKIELGLINNKHAIEQFADKLPEYIFILANHDPDSEVLKREISNLPDCPFVELKFAVSSFMGYGLYEYNVLGLKEFEKLL